MTRAASRRLSINTDYFSQKVAREFMDNTGKLRARISDFLDGRRSEPWS